MATVFQFPFDRSEPLKDKELLFAVGGRAGLFVKVSCGGEETFVELKDITRGRRHGCARG